MLPLTEGQEVNLTRLQDLWQLSCNQFCGPTGTLSLWWTDCPPATSSWSRMISIGWLQYLCDLSADLMSKHWVQAVICKYENLSTHTIAAAWSTKLSPEFQSRQASDSRETWTNALIVNTEHIPRCLITQVPRGNFTIVIRLTKMTHLATLDLNRDFRWSTVNEIFPKLGWQWCLARLFASRLSLRSCLCNWGLPTNLELSDR